MPIWSLDRLIAKLSDPTDWFVEVALGSDSVEGLSGPLPLTGAMRCLGEALLERANDDCRVTVRLAALGGLIGICEWRDKHGQASWLEGWLDLAAPCAWAATRMLVNSYARSAAGSRLDLPGRVERLQAQSVLESFVFIEPAWAFPRAGSPGDIVRYDLASLDIRTFYSPPRTEKALGNPLIQNQSPCQVPKLTPEITLGDPSVECWAPEEMVQRAQTLHTRLRPTRTVLYGRPALIRDNLLALLNDAPAAEPDAPTDDVRTQPVAGPGKKPERERNRVKKEATMVAAVAGSPALSGQPAAAWAEATGLSPSTVRRILEDEPRTAAWRMVWEMHWSALAESELKPKRRKRKSRR